MSFLHWYTVMEIRMTRTADCRKNTQVVAEENPQAEAATPPRVEPRYPPTSSEHSHKLVTIPAAASSFAPASWVIKLRQVIRVVERPRPWKRRPQTVLRGEGGQGRKGEGPKSR